LTRPLPSDASTIACDRCGGVASLDVFSPRIRCPYCAHEQGVPPERLAQLAGYQRAAGDLVKRVGVEETQRAQWEGWYGANGKSKKGYLWSVAIFGAMAVVYAIGMLLLFAHVIREETLARVLPIGILGVFVGGMAIVTARYRRRAGRPVSPVAHVAAQCPRCGGSLAFEAGRVTERCEHCGVSLVAGPAVQREAIDRTRADLRRASMARYRVERNAMSTLYRSSAAGVMPYIVLGSFFPLTGGVAFAISISALTSDEPAPPFFAIGIAWALAFVNFSALALVFLVRRAKRDRWRAVAYAAAARIDGRVSTTVGEWLAWLNAFWIAP
jgi:hypothetical protein